MSSSKTGCNLKFEAFAIICRSLELGLSFLEQQFYSIEVLTHKLIGLKMVEAQNLWIFVIINLLSLPFQTLIEILSVLFKIL